MNEFADVLENLDLLLREREAASSGRIRLWIWHRYHIPSWDCVPGEETAAAAVVSRGKEWLIPVGGTGLLLLDFLARHSHIPLTATQIARGMKNDDYCRKHGLNGGRERLPTAISRSNLKVYIERLRLALGRAFREAGLLLDPAIVLASERTESNQVAYRLRAVTTWLHIDHPKHLAKKDGMETSFANAAYSSAPRRTE